LLYKIHGGTFARTIGSVFIDPCLPKVPGVPSSRENEKARMQQASKMDGSDSTEDQSELAHITCRWVHHNAPPQQRNEQRATRQNSEVHVNRNGRYIVGWPVLEKAVGSGLFSCPDSDRTAGR